MSVAELAAVFSAPAAPVDSSRPPGPTPESELSIALPKDIHEFSAKYGSGRFGDTIQIFNPFSARYRKHIKRVLDCYQPLREDEGDSLVPFELFPNSPGLFPCGDEVNGTMIFWLTEGEPDQWPIVLLAPDGAFEKWDLPLTTLLAKTFRLELHSEIWPDDWIKESLPHLKFQPSKSAASK